MKAGEKKKTCGRIGRTSKLKSKNSESENTTINSAQHNFSQAEESTSTAHDKNPPSPDSAQNVITPKIACSDNCRRCSHLVNEPPPVPGMKWIVS